MTKTKRIGGTGEGIMASLGLPTSRDARHPVTPNNSQMDRERDRIAEIADWVVTNIPWTVAVTDSHCFHDRWPLLTRAELAAVEDELCRRGAALDGRDADLEAIAATLSGRITYWTAAADWLTLNPGSGITHPDFFRMFQQLSRAELILAAIEHRRRVLQGR